MGIGTKGYFFIFVTGLSLATTASARRAFSHGARSAQPSSDVVSYRTRDYSDIPERRLTLGNNYSEGGVFEHGGVLYLRRNGIVTTIHIDQGKLIDKNWRPLKLNKNDLDGLDRFYGDLYRRTKSDSTKKIIQDYLQWRVANSTELVELAKTVPLPPPSFEVTPLPAVVLDPELDKHMKGFIEKYPQYADLPVHPQIKVGEKTKRLMNLRVDQTTGAIEGDSGQYGSGLPLVRGDNGVFYFKLENGNLIPLKNSLYRDHALMVDLEQLYMNRAVKERGYLQQSGFDKLFEHYYRELDEAQAAKKK